MTPAAPASAEPMKNVAGDDAVDVDAHHRRGLPVERHVARIALPSRVQRTRSDERDHQRDRGRR